MFINFLNFEENGRKMKVLLKIIVYTLLTPIFLILLVINLRLHQSPSIQLIAHQLTNQGVFAQLNYLKAQLKMGAGEQMQDIFPEGLMFMYALYGLTWADWLVAAPVTSEQFRQGIAEIDWTLLQMRSEQAKSIFPKGLPLEYGAFYTGWSNYLLGKKLALLASTQRDSSEVREFQEVCEKIYQAYQNQDVVFLESYQGAIWQADNVVCIASLALHDRTFTPKYQNFLQSWIGKVKLHLDPKTGLIPHSARSVSGTMGEGARGSSQNLMLNFLPEIDTSFAKSQFAKYRKHFLDSRFFLPAIREYPKGTEGEGDIDSGLIIYDIGAAASIVGIRAFAQNGDIQTAWQIRNGIEAFGFALDSKEQKYYLFGLLPIADAFIAWANAHVLFLQNDLGHGWQWGFHLLLLLVFFIIFLIIR